MTASLPKDTTEEAKVLRAKMIDDMIPSNEWDRNNEARAFAVLLLSRLSYEELREVEVVAIDGSNDGRGYPETIDGLLDAMPEGWRLDN